MTLKEYLQSVFALEKSCYEQRKLVDDLNRRLEKAKKVEHVEISSYDITFGDLWKEFWLRTIGLIVFVLLPLMFILAIVQGFFDSPAFQTIVMLVLAALLLFFIIYNLVSVIREAIETKRETKEENENALIENERLDTISKAQVAHIQSLLTEEKNVLQQTESILSKYYSTGMIYPKYRNLVAVATFLEYINSGRCTVLEGHEGAYNLFEEEIRWERAFSKLDQISSKLDEISANQYMIAEAIRDSNKQIARLGQSIDESTSSINANLGMIAANQTMSNYYSSLTAQNTAYLVSLQNS